VARTTSYDFELKFDPAKIEYWAKQYGNPEEDRFLNGIRSRVRAAGCYGLEDFRALCKWKSPRSKPLVESNSTFTVESVTREAIETSDEAERMELLRSLRGVEWPTASVLLHIAFEDLYPIVDFRALWSLGYETPPTYNHAFWSAYTTYCRELATVNGVSMRTLDRALWAYSKKNQSTKEKPSSAEWSSESPRQPVYRVVKSPPTQQKSNLIIRLLKKLVEIIKNRKRRV
jgi:hypothetical protein